MFLFQNLVLVAMVFVIFWITFFPLISEALTGTKISVGPPAFRPFIVPLALILVLLSGDRADHRLAPGDGGQPAPQLHASRSSVALGTLVALLLAGGVSRAAVRAAHVRARRVRVRRRRPGVLPRRRRAAGDDHELAAGRAGRSWCERNRRRYGGYIVHAGLAVLLVGVAASIVVPALPRRDPDARPAA